MTSSAPEEPPLRTRIGMTAWTAAEEDVPDCRPVNAGARRRRPGTSDSRRRGPRRMPVQCGRLGRGCPARVARPGPTLRRCLRSVLPPHPADERWCRRRAGAEAKWVCTGCGLGSTAAPRPSKTTRFRAVSPPPSSQSETGRHGRGPRQRRQPARPAHTFLPGPPTQRCSAHAPVARAARHGGHNQGEIRGRTPTDLPGCLICRTDAGIGHIPHLEARLSCRPSPGHVQDDRWAEIEGLPGHTFR